MLREEYREQRIEERGKKQEERCCVKRIDERGKKQEERCCVKNIENRIEERKENDLINCTAFESLVRGEIWVANDVDKEW